jgi:hypothetical protein
MVGRGPRGNSASQRRRFQASCGHDLILQMMSDIDNDWHARSSGNGYELEVKADEPATSACTVKLRSGTAPRGERVEQRPVAALPVDGQHGWPR